MPETLQYVYTSRAEVESLLSKLGVDLRLDDDADGTVSPGEETYLDEAIEEATDIINQYLLLRYDAPALADSLWVRRRAAWITCHLLSQRRGNPRQFTQRYEEIIADLEKVSRGILHVPRIPTSANLLPACSNYVIDDRFRVNKIRVQPSISPNSQHSNQDKDIVLNPYE